LEFNPNYTELLKENSSYNNLNQNIMKRKFAGLALLAILIASVTSGCIVREGYGYHHHYYHPY
jgi:hypothetical protein